MTVGSALQFRDGQMATQDSPPPKKNPWDIYLNYPKSYLLILLGSFFIYWSPWMQFFGKACCCCCEDSLRKRRDSSLAKTELNSVGQVSKIKLGSSQLAAASAEVNFEMWKSIKPATQSVCNEWSLTKTFFLEQKPFSLDLNWVVVTQGSLLLAPRLFLI